MNLRASRPITVAGSPARPAGPSLLIVDDDPLVRGLVARWLRGAGYQCGEAGDAAAAWDYLELHPVELVTLDITMPGCSGLELLTRLREGFPDTEVVMLTATSETHTAIDALTHGAGGYLIKPVSREELLFQVNRGLERRQMIVERRQYTQRLEATVREQTRTIREAHEETVHRLVAASMCRDEETGAHIRRTGLFSEALARAAGWPRVLVEHIRMAAPMHDVGKIGIPDAILRKPGRLTREEFEVMQTHAAIGARMLAGSTSPILNMAAEIALAHHERWDGGGYPSGLSGADIPETARIVAIVDVYDALTHDRVYRPALPEAEVLAIMQNGRGTHFDPALLDCFFCALPEIGRIAEEHPDEAHDELEQVLAAAGVDGASIRCSDRVTEHSHAAC